jgi:hypothetical protein
MDEDKIVSVRVESEDFAETLNDTKIIYQSPRIKSMANQYAFITRVNSSAMIYHLLNINGWLQVLEF